MVDNNQLAEQQALANSLTTLISISLTPDGNLRLDPGLSVPKWQIIGALEVALVALKNSYNT